MSETYSRRTVVSLSAVAAIALPLGLKRFSALAQESTPIAGAPALPPGCTVVASGLMNPRYVAVDADGTLYVSEAGAAGDEKIFEPVGEGTPEAQAAVLTSRGLTGQVTKVAPDGTQSVLAAGLPSYSFGTEVVGPAGITISNGKIFLAIGGPGPATSIVPPIPNQDSVVSIDPATGTVTLVADLGAYERSTNPDPNAVDSDLYGIDAAPDGTLYVADAGGNVVYKVDQTTGEFSVLADIPGLPFEGANPNRGGANEIDPVPTGVAVGPDGNIYVALLSGGPFPAGAAKVLKITPDGEISDAVTGLTMGADVAFSPDGALYASQLSLNLLQSPPANGNVVVANADGTTSVVVGDLFIVNGISFDGAGNLYIVVNASAPAGTPPVGMVLKCAMPAAVASPVATPQG
jgi:sugar lactone lactonase YvrE